MRRWFVVKETSCKRAQKMDNCHFFQLAAFCFKLYRTLPAPEALSKGPIADGLRDMQGLAARFFGGRSVAEPGVARTNVE